MGYAPERKEAVLNKLLAPHDRTVKQLAHEEGISEARIYSWRKQARAEGRLLRDDRPDREALCVSLVSDSAKRFSCIT